MAVRKARAKEILQRFLDSIPALRQSPMDSEVSIKWCKDIEIALEYIFGQNSRQLNEFIQVVSTHMRLIFMGNNYQNYKNTYTKHLGRAEAILQSRIEEIEEYWPDDDQAQNPSAIPETRKQVNTNQVFIIHGRDTGTLAMVARVLENLELQPVILQEQPDGGRTIIQKFEEYAQVNFAIALFTPDDVGGLEGDDLRSRARQNVIFEFGYFIGKYGPERVRALVKGNVEIPSDYSGVIYISLDDSNGWKMHLVRELKSAGFDVDANRLFE